MKKLILAIALIGIGSTTFATCAQAATRPAKVVFVETETVYENVYVEKEVCTRERVEYTTPSGDVLGGLIIGGILGKIITGDDGGAAVGAVLGAGIEGNKRKHVGHGYETKCEIVVEPVKREINMYVVHWKYKGKRGYFFTEKKHYVGHTIHVDVGH